MTGPNLKARLAAHGNDVAELCLNSKMRTENLMGLLSVTGTKRPENERYFCVTSIVGVLRNSGPLLVVVFMSCSAEIHRVTGLVAVILDRSLAKSDIHVIIHHCRTGS